jgi:large subunit ribosomal protein L35
MNGSELAPRILTRDSFDLRPAASRRTFPDKSLAMAGMGLCFRPLSMQKTKKSIAKRFKLTARGKLVRRTPGFRHLLGAKSTKQKRRASRDKLVAEGHAKPLKRALPFGL